MALSSRLRHTTDRLVRPLAAGLARLGVTPNALTVAGAVVVLAGSAAVVAGEPRLGGVVILAGASLDALDGALARHTDSASPLGAFLDSATDRIADAAMLGAVAWLVADAPLLLGAALAALSLALVTSYLRAKAESLGWRASAGVVERTERVVLVAAGLIVPAVLPLALAVLVAGGLLTVVMRLVVVVRQARAPDGASGAGRA